MSTTMIKSIAPLHSQWLTQDPFLFCAFHHDQYPRGNGKLGPTGKEHFSGRSMGHDFSGRNGWSMYHGKRVPGFPGHPHRGFETVTIALEGMVDHSDSLGSTGRFGNGDVQWMTAGKGVQHSEMFPLIHRTKENPLLLFQIWLNLPKSSKMVEPYYGMMWSEDIPKVYKKDEDQLETKIQLIAGSLEGKEAIKPAPDSWAADPENQVAIWLLRMNGNASFTIPATSPDANRSLYLYKGNEISIGEQVIKNLHQVDLKSDEEVSIKNGSETSHMLFLQGKPLNEPVVQYGPFVMNTQEEIQQTFEEYQRTQFGGWPWPEVEHVHPPEQGRFAKYVDGTVEEK
jgi:redox-sensitive bicupin YhaK (pirin superfamily)